MAHARLWASPASLTSGPWTGPWMSPKPFMVRIFCMKPFASPCLPLPPLPWFALRPRFGWAGSRTARALTNVASPLLLVGTVGLKALRELYPRSLHERLDGQQRTEWLAHHAKLLTAAELKSAAWQKEQESAKPSDGEKASAGPPWVALAPPWNAHLGRLQEARAAKTAELKACVELLNQLAKDYEVRDPLPLASSPSQFHARLRDFFLCVPTHRP